MRPTTGRFGAVLATAALLLALPGAARAQQQFQIAGRGGIGIPTGDLADIADVGPTFGLKLAYRVHPRVALRVDGDVEILGGADLNSGAQAPDLTLWHYNGGVEVEVLEPGRSPWSLAVNAGAGATTFDSDQFAGVSGGNDFSETYFSLNGGLEIGYDVQSNVRVYVAGQAYVIFADEQDTAAFAALSPEVNAFDTVLSIPVTAGVSIALR
jgi:hypothetical protein